MHLKLYISSDV